MRNNDWAMGQLVESVVKTSIPVMKADGYSTYTIQMSGFTESPSMNTFSPLLSTFASNKNEDSRDVLSQLTVNNAKLLKDIVKIIKPEVINQHKFYQEAKEMAWGCLLKLAIQYAMYAELKGQRMTPVPEGYQAYEQQIINFINHPNMKTFRPLVDGFRDTSKHDILAGILMNNTKFLTALVHRIGPEVKYYPENYYVVKEMAWPLFVKLAEWRTASMAGA